MAKIVILEFLKICYELQLYSSDCLPFCQFYSNLKIFQKTVNFL